MSRSFRFKEENFFAMKAPFPCMNMCEPGHPINRWLILLKNAAVALNHLFCYHFFIHPEPVWNLCVVEGQDLEGSALELLPRGPGPPWIPAFLRAFLRAEKGWLCLYRLPCSCHAGSLIHAIRFFRKEKSSLLPCGVLPTPHRGFLHSLGSIFRSVCASWGGFLLPWESFHHRRSFGAAAVPLPLTREASRLSTL